MTAQEHIYVHDVDLEQPQSWRRAATAVALRRLWRRRISAHRPLRRPGTEQRIVRDVAAVVLRVGRPPGALPA